MDSFDSAHTDSGSVPKDTIESRTPITARVDPWRPSLARCLLLDGPLLAAVSARSRGRRSTAQRTDRASGYVKVQMSVTLKRVIDIWHSSAHAGNLPATFVVSATCVVHAPMTIMRLAEGRVQWSDAGVPFACAWSAKSSALFPGNVASPACNVRRRKCLL